MYIIHYAIFQSDTGKSDHIGSIIFLKITSLLTSKRKARRKIYRSIFIDRCTAGHYTMIWTLNDKKMKILRDGLINRISRNVCFKEDKNRLDTYYNIVDWGHLKSMSNNQGDK